MGHSWRDFEDFKETSKALPPQGEGETMATQAATAMCKLVYRWFNDGDVFDNSYGLRGWLNDLSSYANWLYNHIKETRPILDGIKTITKEPQYADLLYDAAKAIEETIPELREIPGIDSVYDEKGPFRFSMPEDEDDEEGEYDAAYKAWDGFLTVKDMPSGGKYWEDRE